MIDLAMKNYTDIEQSKKLAEILPIESADMAWCEKGVNYTDEYSAHLCTVKKMQECFDESFVGWDKHWKLIPCWSLAALLEVLRDYEISQKTNGIAEVYCYWFILESEGDETLLDVVVNMIVLLHKEGLR